MIKPSINFFLHVLPDVHFPFSSKIFKSWTIIKIL